MSYAKIKKTHLISDLSICLIKMHKSGHSVTLTIGSCCFVLPDSVFQNPVKHVIFKYYVTSKKEK